MSLNSRFLGLLFLFSWQSPGLYFIGLPWLYTWGSGRFCEVKDDANFLADIISLRSNKSAAAKEMLECKALLGS